MARDLTDETYYTAQMGSKIPVKWTAPEASMRESSYMVQYTNKYSLAILECNNEHSFLHDAMHCNLECVCIHDLFIKAKQPCSPVAQ